MIREIKNIDFILILSVIPLLMAGLITMKVLGGGDDYFFSRQIIWIGIAFLVFFIMRQIDWRFLKNGALLLILYGVGILMLAALFFLGSRIHGAASWIDFKLFSIEPAEPMKLIVIFLLSKYFARRHIAIANIKHIFVSAVFVAIPATLILLQPDFGSALIFVFIWFGMVLVSGISRKHLAFVILIGILMFMIGWNFVLAPYQKSRIETFINPFLDPKGAGYNAVQAMVAVGSGGVFGKGIGQGTQSRLEFLPEHETDFIFAAFAEEWGFVGVIFLFIFFGILLWRVLKVSFIGHSNFERLFSMGFATLLFAHIFIHVGMNTGLLPITGITLPFLSYGGSAIITLFAGLGILDSMRRYSLDMPRSDYKSMLAEGV